MKRLYTIPLALVPLIANAQIDYSTFEAEVILTNAQIAAHTGQSSVSLSIVEDAPDGRIYIYTGSQVSDSLAGIVAVDLSGVSPIFETIALEGDLLPHMDSIAPFAYSIDVATDGTIYFQEFVTTGQIDDILRIVPGSPSPTVTNLRRLNGISGVTLNAAEDRLYICQANNFLAASNDFVYIPVTGGSDVVVASDATIQSAVGGTEAGLRPAPVETGSGDFLIWNEAFFQGTDSLLSITAGGTVTEVISSGAWDSGNSGGIIAMDIADDDTVFAWNQFAGDSVRSLHVLPNAGTGAQIKFTLAEINTALTASVGSSYSYSMSNFGNAMGVVPNVNETLIYLTDNTRGDVIQLKFSAPSSSQNDWELY